jgi:hypothetical protein
LVAGSNAGNGATEPKLRGRLPRAEAIADRYGLPGYGAWRAGLERRYSAMPPWYWDELRCQENYISHIRTAIDWQRRERRINQGNAGFYRSLTG